MDTRPCMRRRLSVCKLFCFSKIRICISEKSFLLSQSWNRCGRFPVFPCSRFLRIVPRRRRRGSRYPFGRFGRRCCRPKGLGSAGFAVTNGGSDKKHPSRQSLGNCAESPLFLRLLLPRFSAHRIRNSKRSTRCHFRIGHDNCDCRTSYRAEQTRVCNMSADELLERIVSRIKKECPRRFRDLRQSCDAFLSHGKSPPLRRTRLGN